MIESTILAQINALSSELQRLYLLNSDARRRAAERFPLIRAELKVLWHERRKELCRLNAQADAVAKPVSEWERDLFDEVGAVTDSTEWAAVVSVRERQGRAATQRQDLIELVREVLDEARLDTKPCHTQTLRQLHEQRGQRLEWAESRGRAVPRMVEMT